MVKKLTIPLRKAELLEGFPLLRAIPSRKLRMIGGWCFMDILGPLTLNKRRRLEVPPHPHIGLQTFSWLLKGRVEHQDSLGNCATISAGELNLMTAGRGILHTEDSPKELLDEEQLHLLQLWIALPKGAHNVAPRFDHYRGAMLPQLKLPNALITLLAGEFMGKSIEQPLYSDLIALDIQTVPQKSQISLPLKAHFEYGVLLLEGKGSIIDKDEKIALTQDSLLYIGVSEGEDLKERTLSFEGEKAHLIVIGGEPLKEPLYMWWNYVAPTEEEIRQADKRYREEDLMGFPNIPNEPRERLPSPELPRRFLELNRSS